MTKIFVVDDEGPIADTLTAILNGSGYRARAFYECEAALLASENDHPDCIISDVVMPKLNGVELEVQVRGRLPTCKVILFSGQAATRDKLDAARKQGYELELDQKPIRSTDLLAGLEKTSHQANVQACMVVGELASQPQKRA